MLTAEHPTKTNFDFKGWADENGNLIIEYDGENYINAEDSLAELSFETLNVNVITLYAKFENHAYKMRFYNADNSLLQTVDYIYSSQVGINPPNIVPSYSDNSLELTEVYKWQGWARKIIGNSDIIDVSTLHPTNDMDFIAVYTKTSVYNNILDTKYLVFNNGELSLNQNYRLQGKITLPTQVNDQPVTSISGFNGQYHDGITHIFWALENRALTTIVGSCFSGSTSLVYYEQPDTCRIIGNQAFYQCPKLGADDNSVITDIFEPVTTLGANVIAYLGSGQNVKQHLILPGHGYETIADYAFGGLGSITHLQIGSQSDLCQWISIAGSKITPTKGFYSLGGDISGGLESLKIYISSSDNTSSNRELLLSNLQVYNTSGVQITDQMMTTGNENDPYVWMIF